MFNFLEKFTFKGNFDRGENEIPDIFPFSLKKDVFVRQDLLLTYGKILTDVIERTHNLPDKYQPALWDSCLQTNTSEGLITLLACAMTDQKELFLVYKANVLRKANRVEQEEIRKDYGEKAESDVGVYISFKDYRLTTLLNVYSEMEYCALASLYKTLNLSKAVQLKINELRSSVGLVDAEVAIRQARAIARALSDGKDVAIDSKDIIETAKPDTSSAEKTFAFLDSKRAYVSGLPISYINGIQTGGIGSTGEADMRAIERGLKPFFLSIIHPALLALFKADTEFKSQDFREMETALNAVKTFVLVDDSLISEKSKREIIWRLFDLDAEEELKRIEAEEAEAEADAIANPQPPLQTGQLQTNGAPITNQTNAVG